MILSVKEPDQVAQLLIEGQIGVLPTDTVYGIHCLASNLDLVNKVNLIKNKTENAPLINLISDPTEIEKFNVMVGAFEQKQIDTLWPGPNTLIFEDTFGKTVSFRVPKNDFLIKVLKNTGPLISTSANLHGFPPATDVNQAVEYFGEKVDFYVDGGVLNNPPSSIYMVRGNALEKIR